MRNVAKRKRVRCCSTATSARTVTGSRQCRDALLSLSPLGTTGKFRRVRGVHVVAQSGACSTWRISSDVSDSIRHRHPPYYGDRIQLIADPDAVKVVPGYGLSRVHQASAAHRVESLRRTRPLSDARKLDDPRYAARDQALVSVRSDAGDAALTR